MNVSDVMTTTVVSVRPETPLKEVARLLAERSISGVPVVDAEGHVVGVVSEADFLLKEQEAPPRRPSILAWLFDQSDSQRAYAAKLHATTAGEAMTSPALTTGPDRPIREAAALMTRHEVNRLPVVEDGRLVGIVTRADLVGIFLASDEELRRRVVDEVVRDTLWLEADEVQVEVRDGVVGLTGTVDRRSTANILERLAGRVEGVVGVDSALAWELDDRAMEPVGELSREPTAASIAARERPR